MQYPEQGRNPSAFLLDTLQSEAEQDAILDPVDWKLIRAAALVPGTPLVFLDACPPHALAASLESDSMKIEPGRIATVV